MLSSVHEQNGSHPSWRLLRSAGILPRTFFRFTVLMRAARSLSVGRFGERRCCHSSPGCLRAWSAWKRAVPRITGRATCIKLGHDVRLMPPAYVKPYVKRGKTDAADAEAVCQAVRRPTMRFVPVKSPEQQAALSMHRTRDLLVKPRTQLVNMIRGLLAEFGVDIPKGLERALLMARQIVDGKAPDVPIEAAKIVGTLSQQALDTHVRLREIDRDLAVWLRGNDVARRLTTIPGIGPVGATALAASVTDPHQFRSGRQFAAWLGLTPLQKSSGGKERLGRITKMGDKYLRKLLIVGMTSLVSRAKSRPEKIDPRLANLLARKPVRVATVAMANKTARTIWAIMTRGEIYHAGHRPALAA